MFLYSLIYIVEYVAFYESYSSPTYYIKFSSFELNEPYFLTHIVLRKTNNNLPKRRLET